MNIIPDTNGNYSIDENGVIRDNRTKKILYGSLTSHGYHVVRLNRKFRYVHRILAEVFLGLKPGQYVDHKDGDTLNNNLSNLRCCLPAQNVQNQRLHKNNTSGYRGVSYIKGRNRWYATIQVNGGKTISLGRFKDKQDAILAYKNASDKYFGEFAGVRS